VAVGILGGAFDPPHDGHVALARAAVEQLELERLLVLVVEQPGHKAVATPADVRLALARRAFAHVPGAEVELDPYARTVDSLEARGLRDALFVLGADELASFWSWKRPERILQLVRLAAACRPGVSSDDLRRALARFPPDRVVLFDMVEVPISSSAIRARVARGEDAHGLVPEAVAREIARLGLYGEAE
jgi:nicotinate-nucleotide adenylyltransferase